MSAKIAIQKVNELKVVHQIRERMIQFLKKQNKKFSQNKKNSLNILYQEKKSRNLNEKKCYFWKKHTDTFIE